MTYNKQRAFCRRWMVMRATHYLLSAKIKPSHQFCLMTRCFGAVIYFHGLIFFLCISKLIVLTTQCNQQLPHLATLSTLALVFHQFTNHSSNKSKLHSLHVKTFIFYYKAFISNIKYIL